MIRIAIALLLLRPAVEPDEFTAKVVGVVNGDTITVSNDSYETRIMLSRIDCPERGQAFGKEARQATWDLAYGTQVKVRGYRRNGRVTGVVILPDGTNLNDELVKKGLAWRIPTSERRMKRRSPPPLDPLEAQAREAKRGLWADAEPVPPWVWRNVKRSANAVEPNGMAIVALLPDPAGPDKDHERIKIGNSTDRVVKLDGWKILDTDGHEFALSGQVPADGVLTITVVDSYFSLNNVGDTVELVDPDGVLRGRVSYVGKEIGPGKWVEFGE